MAQNGASIPYSSGPYHTGENLRNPFAVSFALHVGIGVLFLGLTLWKIRTSENQFGAENPGAGAYSVGIVNTINLPSRQGRVQPLADDSPSEIEPAPVKEKKKPKPMFDDEGIKLDDKPSLYKERPSNSSPTASRDPNRVTSNIGQAAVSPMFKQVGGGGIGIGQNAPIGKNFGWYAELIRQKVAEHWRQDEVSPGVRTSNPAIVTFVIQRDGSVKDIRLAKVSGVSALDFSAQRAIQEAAPFPKLPDQFDKDSAAIEFWFELKR